jgi:hypothetical protein
MNRQGVGQMSFASSSARTTKFFNLARKSSGSLPVVVIAEAGMATTNEMSA